MSRVLAVCRISGCGKTTLVKAVARRLEHQTARGTDLAPFLDYYLDFGHAAYDEQARRLRSSSDLVLDGTRAIEVLAEQCADAYRIR